MGEKNSYISIVKMLGILFILIICCMVVFQEKSSSYTVKGVVHTGDSGQYVTINPLFLGAGDYKIEQDKHFSDGEKVSCELTRYPFVSILDDTYIYVLTDIWQEQ